MKSKSAIAAELNCQPWLVSPVVHREFAAAVAKAVAEIGTKAKEPEKPYTVTGDGVAVIPVRGMLWSGWASVIYDPFFGITSTDILQRAIEDADADTSVRAVMLHVDSPGGIVFGVPECAAAVKACAKPVMAYNGGQMDSAAYWIGSQASAIYATPSSRTGSIGAYIAILDMSRYFDKQGMEMQVFRSGENKGMGLPGTSLTDSQRERMQARVDKIGTAFRTAVSQRRPYVSADIMDGDDYDTDDAASAKLIDHVSTPAAAMAALLEMANQHAANEGSSK
jgi:signal peptide peptidase SppA